MDNAIDRSYGEGLSCSGRTQVRCTNLYRLRKVSSIFPILWSLYKAGKTKFAVGASLTEAQTQKDR